VIGHVLPKHHGLSNIPAAFKSLAASLENSYGSVPATDNGSGTNGPVVKVIKDGRWYPAKDGTLGFTSSVTYITDGPDCRIIVDTSVPSDTESLLQVLDQNQIKRLDINWQIATHQHPDHTGNANFFRRAIYIVGNKTLTNEILAFMPPTPRMKLRNEEYEVRFVCPNVALLHVRGHTADDTIILIQNATGFGNVAIMGDMMYAAEDIDNEALWGSGAMFFEEQKNHRRTVIVDSDYVIPGHGPGFRVTEEMRQKLLSQPKADPNWSQSHLFTAIETVKGQANNSISEFFKETLASLKTLAVPGSAQEKGNNFFANLTKH